MTLIARISNPVSAGRPVAAGRPGADRVYHGAAATARYAPGAAGAFLAELNGAMDGDGSGDAAVVESVKAASDVYSPVSGTVTKGNPALEGDPALVNTSPEGEGWFFKLTIADAGELDGLMDQGAYKAFCDGL